MIARQTIVLTVTEQTLVITLTTPASGASISSGPPVFRWSAGNTQSSIISYTLRITGSNNSFSGQSVRHDIISTEPVYTPTVDFPTGVYTWTVRAHGPGDQVSDWVEPPFTFTIQTEADKVYLPMFIK